MKPTLATTLFCRVRARSGYTTRELSELTGIARSTLSDREKHADDLRLREAIEWANACGMTDKEWLELRKRG